MSPAVRRPTAASGLTSADPATAGPRRSTPGPRQDHAMTPRFVPTARQTNWLLCIGFLSVGYAMYLRYRALEFADVSLACQAGLQTWLCATFRTVIELFNQYFFGAVALGAALISL